MIYIVEDDDAIRELEHLPLFLLYQNTFLHS